MRILFLTRSFNGLAQRLYLELAARGHEISVEFDIADSVSDEALALFQPDLVIAPFLKRAIPESVWRRVPCLVVHPGIPGDRGASALDWAIHDAEVNWGVTVLQAEAEMDAGPVWAHQDFAMREAPKSSLYRQEVSAAAVQAVTRAVDRFQADRGPPPPPATRGRLRPLMRQAERAIDWQRDDTATVLRKVHAADGSPGVRDELFGLPCHLFDAHREGRIDAGPPGSVIGRRHEALLRATVDGAVWIGRVRLADEAQAIKLPATTVFAEQAADLPELTVALDDDDPRPTWRDLRWHAEGDVGVLHFDVHNGALGTAQCRRLTAALQWALAQAQPVLLLAGGSDFWCNGIHLNLIEAAASPADESWQNIVAIDELTLTLIQSTHKLVIAAMQGNGGAGGVFMALAADEVWAHPGVVLNPHYKNMGNLHGSEYWTYLLPRRLKNAAAAALMQHRLPVSAASAAELGLLDAVFGATPQHFLAESLARAQAWALSPALPARLAAKAERRRIDEAAKPLAAYRNEELERMHRNFYGFDPSYHMARFNFVHRVAPSWTPRHLARHRKS